MDPGFGDVGTPQGQHLLRDIKKSIPHGKGCFRVSTHSENDLVRIRHPNPVGKGHHV